MVVRRSLVAIAARLHLAKHTFRIASLLRREILPSDAGRPQRWQWQWQRRGSSTRPPACQSRRLAFGVRGEVRSVPGNAGRLQPCRLRYRWAVDDARSSGPPPSRSHLISFLHISTSSTSRTPGRHYSSPLSGHSNCEVDNLAAEYDACMTFPAETFLTNVEQQSEPPA